MKKIKFSTKLPVLLVAVVAFGALIAGCGTHSAAPVDNTFQDRGRQLFNANCGTCHNPRTAVIFP